jgi:hypothetical protein
VARASSKTASYEIQSPTTGESRIIVERSYVKATKVANKYLMASKQFALFDTEGRKYERISSVVIKCSQSGERFHVVGEADHIRKTA